VDWQRRTRRPPSVGSFKCRVGFERHNALGSSRAGGEALVDSHEIWIVGEWRYTAGGYHSALGSSATPIGDYWYEAITPVRVTSGARYRRNYPAKTYPSAEEDVLINSTQAHSGVSFVSALQSDLSTSGSFEFPTIDSFDNQGTSGRISHSIRLRRRRQRPPRSFWRPSALLAEGLLKRRA
jgi:hypothetical protein